MLHSRYNRSPVPLPSRTRHAPSFCQMGPSGESAHNIQGAKVEHRIIGSDELTTQLRSSLEPRKAQHGPFLNLRSLSRCPWTREAWAETQSSRDPLHIATTNIVCKKINLNILCRIFFIYIKN